MRRKPTARNSRRRLTRIKRVAGPPPTSEERFRLLLEELHIGVLLMGPRAEIQYANQAALDMCGMTRKQVLGKTSEELGLVALHEDGTEVGLSMRPSARAAGSGRPVRNQVIGFRHADSDEVLWTYGSAVPEFEADGSVRRVVVTLTDITERRNALAALEKANELNREILSSAQEGIVVHDRQLRYALWNPYMERISGMKAEEVLGKHPLDLFPFMDTEGLYADMQKALAGQVIASHDIHYTVPQTGLAGWCNNNFAPLRDDKGEIVGVVATVRDITERKKREDELQELSGRLLQLQDEERRRIARDLHDSFAQGLLAVNLNLAQLSKSGGTLNPQGRQAVADAHKITKGLAREIRSLSYLLHPPVLDELGLGAAIEEYANGFSRRSGIHTDVEISPEIGRLPQEIETALFRIVQESLGNIQRHSGSSRARIEMKKDSSGLTLEVSDEGRGIPREYLEKQPERPSALGVGVFGMRERMRQLGGQLEFTSGSSGTTVRATLPLQAEVHHASSHTHSR
jgi:two-component system, NarL family, sensor kinase